jgi:hypothetical protein
MAIKPGSTPIAYNSVGVGSGIVYCDEIMMTTALQNYDRSEFSAPRLRSAPTSTGALPLIVQAFGNQPVQLVTTCTGDAPRPLGPDDSNITAIKQRFGIQRFTLKGIGTVTDIQNHLMNTFATHLGLLNKFDLYLAELQMELSITYLESLQSQTFSYLTSTGLSLSGNALGSSAPTTLNNLLMTALEMDVMYEAPTPGSSTSQILQGFTMTVEQRVISAQGS